MQTGEIRKATDLGGRQSVLLRIPKALWLSIGSPKYYRTYVENGKLVIEPVS